MAVSVAVAAASISVSVIVRVGRSITGGESSGTGQGVKSHNGPGQVIVRGSQEKFTTAGIYRVDFQRVGVRRHQIGRFGLTDLTF